MLPGLKEVEKLAQWRKMQHFYLERGMDVHVTRDNMKFLVLVASQNMKLVYAIGTI